MDFSLALARSRAPSMVLGAVVTAAAVLAAGPGATPTHASASGDTYPAKLKVLRAGVENGRLDVLADITKRADGDRVRVSFIANGKRSRLTAAVEDGRIRFQRLLPSSQRRASTGIMEINYGGNDRVRPTEVRLRAANGKARLQRDMLSLHNGVITARGSVTDRAHGVVRLILSFERPNGTVGEWQGRASIRDDGSWRLEENLPADARAGGYLSIQFTGSYPRRLRGEQTAKQLLDGQAVGLPSTTTMEPAPAGGSVSQAPAPAPTPTAKATLRSVGSLALSDSEAAARVSRNGVEPRPSSLPTATASNYDGGRFSNYPMNQVVATDAELAIFNSYAENQWFMSTGKITGQFTGTTDEILQWAAHKWGWDEDVVRAVAVKESNYNQGAYTWPGSDQYQGGGIMSITWSQNPTSHLLGAKSTAFNVDLFLAYMRTCFDGKETWLNDTGDAGQPYEAGDMWGCIGRWYAGRWHTEGAKWYIGEVQKVLANRTWDAPGY